ncbi:MAG: shikimate kinase [Firmicutes bacterium]|nr:shikimate kinase [Bacillota bacterium]
MANSNSRKSNSTKCIALIGFMATGKSTIGPLLAEKMGYTFVDTDAMVEADMGVKISDIFSEMGEDVFRNAEHEALKKALGMEDSVLSTGGGIILFERNRELLAEKAFVVSLAAQAETIFNRVKGDKTRPLLQCEDPLLRIKQMIAERQQYYNTCDLKISTDNLSAEACCQRIIEAYEKE